MAEEKTTRRRRKKKSTDTSSKKGSGKKKRTRTKDVVIDFDGVDPDGVVVPEGTYILVVDEATTEKGPKAKYTKWKFKTEDDEKVCNNKSVYENTSHSPDALFKLRGLLECLGVEVPDGPMALKYDDYVGLKCLGTIAHRIYEGKKQMQITGIEPLSEMGDEDDDEDEGEEDPEVVDDDTTEDDEGEDPDDDDAEGITASEIEGMNEEELTEALSDYGLKISGRIKNLKKKKAAAIAAFEEADLLDEKLH